MFRGKSGRLIFTARCGANKTFSQKNLFNDNDGFSSVVINTDKARLFEIKMENESGSYFEINGGIDVGFTAEESAR